MTLLSNSKLLHTLITTSHIWTLTTKDLIAELWSNNATPFSRGTSKLESVLIRILIDQTLRKVCSTPRTTYSNGWTTICCRTRSHQSLQEYTSIKTLCEHVSSCKLMKTPKERVTPHQNWKACLSRFTAATQQTADITSLPSKNILRSLTNKVPLTNNFLPRSKSHIVFRTKTKCSYSSTSTVILLKVRKSRRIVRLMLKHTLVSSWLEVGARRRLQQTNIYRSLNKMQQASTVRISNLCPAHIWHLLTSILPSKTALFRPNLNP